jgi:hypothetical protein
MSGLVRGIGGITAWLANASFVALTAMGAMYALAPNAQRWVELNVLTRTAYFYVGTIDGSGAEGTFRDVQFYSTRWDVNGKIDLRQSEGDTSIWTVIRKLQGEIVIVRTRKKADEFEPVPGRREPKPTGAIEIGAVNGECYYVREVACVTFSGSRQTDAGCVAAETQSTVALWVRASRVTCS